LAAAIEEQSSLDWAARWDSVGGGARLAEGAVGKDGGPGQGCREKKWQQPPAGRWPRRTAAWGKGKRIVIS